MRAGVLGRNVSGKSFVADRRINERRGRGDYGRKPEGAGGATLFVRLRFRRVPFAIVTRRLRLHLRAIIHFLEFGNERLARNNSE